MKKKTTDQQIHVLEVTKKFYSETIWSRQICLRICVEENRVRKSIFARAGTSTSCSCFTHLSVEIERERGFLLLTAFCSKQTLPCHRVQIDLVTLKEGVWNETSKCVTFRRATKKKYIYTHNFYALILSLLPWAKNRVKQNHPITRLLTSKLLIFWIKSHFNLLARNSAETFVFNNYIVYNRFIHIYYMNNFLTNWHVKFLHLFCLTGFTCDLSCTTGYIRVNKIRVYTIDRTYI